MERTNEMRHERATRVGEPAHRPAARRRSKVWVVVAAAILCLGVAGCRKQHPDPRPPYPPTRTRTPAPPDVTRTPGGPQSKTPTPTPTKTGGVPCAVPSINVDQSLVVHTPSELAASFGLRKTLEQIVTTSGLGIPPADVPKAAEDLLKTMLDSFLESSFEQPISGKIIPVKVRPQEAALSVTELLDPASANGMIPVGLFNRLDLAPADGSNCGEYRIVYAKKQPGRFFIIFESKLPNPSTGLAGCQPVARFWADLSANPSATDRITQLEEFYYQGKTLGGSTFDPVVAHANYGVPFGQVRTNLFVEFFWELREHRTAFDTTSTAPIFKVDTVKENPLVEWFRDPSTLPSGITPADHAAFRAHFLANPICNLLRPDRVDPSASTNDVVNGIGPGFDPAGDDLRSVSHNDEDDPAVDTDPGFTTAANARLGQLGVTTVSSGEMLNRAGAMTCGGCHQFSNGKPLGNGHTWPPSAGFVHIDESGGLSPALTGTFLPDRATFLARFVCDPTAAPKPEAPCPTPAATRALRRAQRAPLPALPSAEGLDAAPRTQLVRGRRAAIYRPVDEARAAFLASAKRQSRRERDVSASRRDVRNAATVLEARVLKAREAEQRLPGAFYPVRRTH